MVTHDTRLIDKCDKVFMMEDGVFQEKQNKHKKKVCMWFIAITKTRKKDFT